jgi:DNA ligase 1
MKRFTELFFQLDRTNKTNDKIELLKSYFLTAPAEDKIWALALFTGRRPPRKIKTSQIQEWALEVSGIPYWLYRECYSSVGDLAETISLLLPNNPSSSSLSLNEWFSSFEKLSDSTNSEKKAFIINAWKQLSPYEIFVFNKLLMGSFRIGVSHTLVIRALANSIDTDPAILTHRIMGHWDPFKISFQELIHAENSADNTSQPYPFYLAYAIEEDIEDMGSPEEWLVEWKWDGIRSQLIHRKNEIYIWSRGEELITDKFPELLRIKKFLPEGIVLDGEIVCFSNGQPMPFNILQTRIGRKNLTKKILEEAPVAFLAYDVLEHNSIDIRQKPQQERRIILEEIIGRISLPETISISPLIKFEQWHQLKELHQLSREHFAEGFMLKRKNASYLTGRKKGDWWKWKIEPLSVDAVLIYAQKGHGRRAELYTDYTFGVWHEGKLISFAKAYSGLTDKEIVEVDRFIRKNTLEKFGPVRTVKPELVFQIGFEGINSSSRHKSGIAVRFPRILRWRTDKPVSEADTLENLKSILETYNNPVR